MSNCPLTHKNIICSANTCDECIEELLNSIEEKQKFIEKQSELIKEKNNEILALNKQVAKQHVEITKQRRQLLGHRNTIENLHKRLGDRDEYFKGNEFENKDSYKGWKG